MAVSEDVMELVALLDKEDFSMLAGELLTEISLGWEMETDDGAVKRIPIPVEQQLEEALKFLRLRLTEPARKLVEAEEIATQLNGNSPVSIIFERLGPIGDDPLRGEASDRQRGETKSIDELEAAFTRLANRTIGGD